MIRFLQQDNGVVKAVFWTIIVVVSAFMVITLVPGIFQGGGDVNNDYAIVRIGGLFGRFFTHSEDISLQDVQRLAAAQLQRQHLPPQYASIFVPQAGNALIQQAILVHEAKRLGLEVTDADLSQYLHTGQFGDALFPGGKFIGDDQYANLISTNFNMSVERFEDTIKREMMLQRLQQMITAPITVSDSEVRKEYAGQATKVKFEFVTLNPADVLSTINPTDAELESYFKAHTTQYAKAIGESRKLQYVAIDPSQVPGGVPQVTDAQLQSYYQQHITQFQNKEQVRVRHILIAVNDKTPDAVALKKAQDIEAQLKKGGDFAKLAEQNSDDPGSKVKGGELGFIQKGVTVPEFEQVAFSQNVGQISAPVKSQFGYHIIQTEEKQPAGTKSFAQVKQQILPIVQRDAELKAAQDFANKLAAQAKSSSLEKAAAQYHFTVQTTDYLQRNGVVNGLPDSAQVMSGAFDMKPNAPPQVAADGEGFAVYTVTGVQPAHAPNFAEFKDHVLQDYRSEKLLSVMQDKLKKVAEEARTTGNLQKAAEDNGAKFGTSDLVGRDAQVPQLGPIAQSADTIFALNVGQISQPIAGQSGEFVVKLTDKQEPTQQDMQAHFTDTKDKLLSDKRERAFDIYASELQDRYQRERRILITKNANRSALDNGM